jgi:hypothetical protein
LTNLATATGVRAPGASWRQLRRRGDRFISIRRVKLSSVLADIQIIAMLVIDGRK